MLILSELTRFARMATWQDNIKRLLDVKRAERFVSERSERAKNYDLVFYEYLTNVAKALRATDFKFRDDHRAGQPWRTDVKYVYVNQLYHRSEPNGVPATYRMATTNPAGQPCFLSPGYFGYQTRSPLYVHTTGEVHLLGQSSGRTITEMDGKVLERGLVLSVITWDNDIETCYALPMEVFVSTMLEQN